MKFTEFLDSLNVDLAKLERKYVNNQTDENKKAIKALKEVISKLNGLYKLAFDVLMDKLFKKATEPSELEQLVNLIGPGGIPQIIPPNKHKVAGDHIVAVDEANFELAEIIFMYLRIATTNIDDSVIQTICNEHPKGIEQYRARLANQINRAQHNRSVVPLFKKKMAIDVSFQSIEKTLLNISVNTKPVEGGVAVLPATDAFSLLCEAYSQILDHLEAAKQLPWYEIQFLEDHALYLSQHDSTLLRTHVRISLWHTGITLLERVCKTCDEVYLIEPNVQFKELSTEANKQRSVMDVELTEIVKEQHRKIATAEHQYPWQLMLRKKLFEDIAKLETLLPKEKSDPKISFFSPSSKEPKVQPSVVSTCVFVDAELIPLRAYLATLRAAFFTMEGHLNCQTPAVVVVLEKIIKDNRLAANNLCKQYDEKAFGNVNLNKHPIYECIKDTKDKRYPTFVEYIQEQEIALKRPVSMASTLTSMASPSPLSSPTASPSASPSPLANGAMLFSKNSEASVVAGLGLTDLSKTSIVGNELNQSIVSSPSPSPSPSPSKP